MTPRPTRYQPIAVEDFGGRRVARVLNRASGDEIGYYELRRGKRKYVVTFAHDTPCRDQALRKLVRKMLAA